MKIYSANTILNQQMNSQNLAHFAINKQEFSEILYYKILETTMVQATQRLPGIDMSVILQQDTYISSFLDGLLLGNCPLCL